jgi:hypothetical protein
MADIAVAPDEMAGSVVRPGLPGGPTSFNTQVIPGDLQPAHYRCGAPVASEPRRSAHTTSTDYAFIMVPLGDAASARKWRRP